MISRALARLFWSWFGVTSQLPFGETDRQKHLNALVNLSGDQKELFAHLYMNLDALDAKSSTLIQFDAILIVIYVALISGILGNAPSDATFVTVIALSAGGLLSLLSALGLLTVEWVHWSTTTQLENPKSHLHRLLRVRNWRTVRYRISWYLSSFSLLCLSIFLFVEIRILLPACFN